MFTPWKVTGAPRGHRDRRGDVPWGLLGPVGFPLGPWAGAAPRPPPRGEPRVGWGPLALRAEP